MNIRYKNMKVITITGKIEEHSDALRFCYRNGYYPTRTGMRTTRRRYDNTRYRIVAEKEII